MSEPTMNMLMEDSKERQRRENYRRAEAFLMWKFGTHYDRFRQYLDGSGMDWPSLFVEFVEKVEDELFERTRIIEEQNMKSMMLRFATEPMPCMFTKEEIQRLQENTKQAEVKENP